MIYTVTQIKQGTGFRRGAAFIEITHLPDVARDVIAECVAEANRTLDQGDFIVADVPDAETFMADIIRRLQFILDDEEGE